MHTVKPNQNRKQTPETIDERSENSLLMFSLKYIFFVILKGHANC